MRNFRLTAPATALWVLMAGPALSATIPVEQYVVNLADVNTNVPAYNMGCLITTGECRVNPTDTAAAFSTLSPMTPAAGGATNLGIGTHDATQLVVTSDTGTDATLPLTTAVAGTNKAGLMSPAEKDKLTGIEAGADVTDSTNVAAAGAVMTTGNQTVGGVKDFTSDPTIPDEAYGVGWDGVLEPPTKNAVYDKIETISAGDGAPTNAQYITGASDATLSAERVVTDTPTVDMDTGTAGQLKAHVRYLRAASANSVTTAGGWTPAVDDVVTDRASVTATSGGTLVVALPSADNAVSGSTEPAALEIANASGGEITVDLSAYTLASDQEYPNTIANGSFRRYYIESDDGGTTWKLDGRDKPSGYPSATVDLANDLCVFGDTNDSGRLKQTACTNISGPGSGTVDTSGTPVANDFAKFTDANTIEGRSYSEVRTDLNVEDGADVTDTANVTAAGALMDSEVDADIKTLSLPASTTVSAFGATLVDDADAATARATLGVDQPYCVALTAQDGDATVVAGPSVPLFFDTAVTVVDARAFVKTAPTGANMIIDINEAGTSIMTTNKIVIEATEKTSGLATTQPTITDTTIAANAEITFDIDQIGSTVAGAGVVACLTVRQ